MVVSDHGFGSLDYYLHLNAWLVENGYLRFKRTPGVMLKYLAYRLGLTPLNILETLRKLHLAGPVQKTAGDHNEALRRVIKHVFLSLDDIDWSRTTVYTRGFAGPLFVNLKGREPQGIVEPGEEFEAVLKKLESDVRRIKHPVTGEPFVSQTLRTEDAYSGPYVKYAPDFGFGMNDLKHSAFRRARLCVQSLVRADSGSHGHSSHEWNILPARSGRSARCSRRGGRLD
jgi:predicted AlkP superfamily phosphohydrolase/phosphomutase